MVDAARAHLSPSAEPVRPRFAVAPSKGLRSIRFIERFLGLEAVLSPNDQRRRSVSADVVLAWGRKPSARVAEDYAAENNLPIWYLEDGWIRSASADAHSRTCYSLLVDTQGVYYDSRTPSAIETFLNRPDAELQLDLDAGGLDHARECRERLVAANITKYNYCPQARLPADDSRPLVLVVDQTRDDASVRYGGMDADAFIAMLDAAQAENPEARVMVRTHPDVVAGRRAGYLDVAARERGVTLLAHGDDPMPWLKRAARVYVGTSQLGYEALLCERPVTVFGQPFYAGWGLTDDRQPLTRRRYRRRLDELFHATHIALARYVSPLSGEPWRLDECLDHVALQRRQFAANARHFRCEGITPWKRGYVRQFLRSPDGTVSFSANDATGVVDTRLCWAFRDRPLGTSPMITSDLPVWRMEDGFLRSAGLGSDFTAPGSLVVDSLGMYFDPGTPSDLEVLLETHDCTIADIRRAARLRHRLIEAGVTKYNVGTPVNNVTRSADRTRVLVVGQVENDESVRRGCKGVDTNTALLQAVRKTLPDAWIVYRPHPDVEAGNRTGQADPVAVQACADEVDAKSPIGDCLDACDELHTMTSLAGFEALLRGKQVTTYGSPFYAGWGLTHDQATTPRRTRRRTLDEMVFLTLIAYPRYVDIASGEFVTAEDMVDIIEREKQEVSRQAASRAGWAGRQVVKVVNIARGLRYAP